MIRFARVMLPALALAALPLIMGGVQAKTAAATANARTVPLTITSGGKAQHFQVEIAATPGEQERGLMYRRSMAPDRGMIFPMSPPRPASFWMKNTFIPLDIIFIGPDRKIIRVAENAQPLSLDLIECPEPVAAVLELNGGAARQWHIAAGDKVRW